MIMNAHAQSSRPFPMLSNEAIGTRPARGSRMRKRTLGTEGPWVDASMIGTWKVHPCPVGGIPTPLKNMKVSWDFSPQHMEK